MRYLSTLLAVMTTACVLGTSVAAARTDANDPNQVIVTRTDLRNPDNRVAAVHAGASVAVAPDTAANTSLVGDVPSDGGLSTFFIVLISVGGAVAIGGVALAATRAVHHHPHPLG